eukprot:scaffold1021_cov241-Pinguiococcus_pyrenoidosus.AAC.19
MALPERGGLRRPAGLQHRVVFRVARVEALVAWRSALRGQQRLHLAPVDAVGGAGPQLPRPRVAVGLGVQPAQDASLEQALLEAGLQGLLQRGDAEAVGRTSAEETRCRPRQAPVGFGLGAVAVQEHLLQSSAAADAFPCREGGFRCPGAGRRCGSRVTVGPLSKLPGPRGRRRRERGRWDGRGSEVAGSFGLLVHVQLEIAASQLLLQHSCLAHDVTQVDVVDQVVLVVVRAGLGRLRSFEPGRARYNAHPGVFELLLKQLGIAAPAFAVRASGDDQPHRDTVLLQRVRQLYEPSCRLGHAHLLVVVRLDVVLLFVTFIQKRKSALFEVRQRHEAIEVGVQHLGQADRLVQRELAPFQPKLTDARREGRDTDALGVQRRRRQRLRGAIGEAVEHPPNGQALVVRVLPLVRRSLHEGLLDGRARTRNVALEGATRNGSVEAGVPKRECFTRTLLVGCSVPVAASERPISRAFGPPVRLTCRACQGSRPAAHCSLVWPSRAFGRWCGWCRAPGKQRQGIMRRHPRLDGAAGMLASPP